MSWFEKKLKIGMNLGGGDSQSPPKSRCILSIAYEQQTVLMSTTEAIVHKQYFGFIFRRGPTDTKVFLCGLSLCGKSRSLQGLLKSKKKLGSNHAFFRHN